MSLRTSGELAYRARTCWREELPEELNQKIVSYFNAIDGWKPAVHMNRKVPVNFTIPIKIGSRY